ncbi:MAG: hypothetical protein EAZ95_12445 [Bacteroidetes bacterium]|nr:MAG: hypothetical protein EAZ95_12445 [Bacteroidota bacterium]
MTALQPHYVLDNQERKVFIQFIAQDWKRFVSEFKQVENILLLKDKLKNTFREMKQIPKGEKESATLHDFFMSCKMSYCKDFV